jgi:hypothetical protein
VNAFLVRERLIEDYLEHQWPRLSRGPACPVALPTLWPMRPVVRKAVTAWPAPQKILEDSGLTEDLGAYRPPNPPLNPNSPRRYSFSRIRIQGLLRIGFMGLVRYGP